MISQTSSIQKAIHYSPIQQKMKTLIDKKILNIRISKYSNPFYEFTNILDDQNPKNQSQIQKVFIYQNQYSKRYYKSTHNAKEQSQQKTNRKNSQSFILPKLSQIKTQTLILIIQLKYSSKIKKSLSINLKYSHLLKTMILYYLSQQKILQKQNFSIFTYINSYRDIQIGTQIYGILTRKQKRNNNQVYFYEMSIKNDIWNPLYKNLPLYGVKYNQRYQQVANNKQYTNTQGFSLSKLALYNDSFQNNQLINKLSKNLDIDLSENINPISNIKALKHLQINFQKIRQYQEKRWSNDHFQEAMQLLKQGLNQPAIDCFDLAKKFDKNNQKIFIGKSCALANMNNFSEGLRQIKEALKINPQNQQANEYYKIIREKLREKQVGPDMKRKVSGNSELKQKK